MKRVILTALALLGVYQLSLGQDVSAREKIESARIALITERLGLTPEQAEKFWPLYNEFKNKTQGLREEYNEARKEVDPKTATEEEKKKILNLGLSLKERRVALEREYSDRMLRIVTAQQIIDLRKAEEDFRRMLLDQIQKRRIQQGRRDQIREKIKDRRNGDN